MALRGQRTIQARPDFATLYNIRPGYLRCPDVKVTTTPGRLRRGRKPATRAVSTFPEVHHKAYERPGDGDAFDPENGERTL
jgi:hypothetical protein